jgi:hypothetical protein
MIQELEVEVSGVRFKKILFSLGVLGDQLSSAKFIKRLSIVNSTVKQPKIVYKRFIKEQERDKTYV